MVEDLESDVPASAIVHSHVRALREREGVRERDGERQKKKGKRRGKNREKYNSIIGKKKRTPEKTR